MDNKEQKPRFFETPEWKEKIAKLNEYARQQNQITLEKLKILNDLLGNISMRKDEQMHPYGLELSIGSKLFDELVELLK